MPRRSTPAFLLAVTTLAGVAGAATVGLGPVVRSVPGPDGGPAALGGARAVTVTAPDGRTGTVLVPPGVEAARTTLGVVDPVVEVPLPATEPDLRVRIRFGRPIGRDGRPIDVAALAGSTGDWTNLGGTAARDGRSPATGPVAADEAWRNDEDPSIIAWHPVTLGNRVFAIRESGFPNSLSPNDRLVAYDLATGDVLWDEVVPYAGDPDEEWIAYVGGANGGLVYCARGGSGRTTPVYAFDAATGDLVWDSTAETVAGPYDGMVFAPDGDPIVGDFDSVLRLDAIDGTVVWETTRSCPVSGACGVAVGNGGVYFDAAAPGGNVITKLDLETGAELYSSPVMPGFTAQNGPFVGLDGTVYFARSQNNILTDFLYAFEDTGSGFVERWNRPIRWTVNHQHGLAADGSIYTVLPGDELVRLDPATGGVTATAGTLSPVGASLSVRTAVGADGTVYLSNGWASSPATDGRIWAYSADLTELLFTLELDRQNSGGPSLAADGTLLVADRQAVIAYRAPADPCPADLDGSGDVGVADLVALLAAWDAVDSPADLDGSGSVGAPDLITLLASWGPCPA